MDRSKSWADLVDDDDSLGADFAQPLELASAGRSKSAPEPSSSKATPATTANKSKFDPELDCSRDGLNLAFTTGLTTKNTTNDATTGATGASPSTARSVASTPKNNGSATPTRASSATAAAAATSSSSRNNNGGARRNMMSSVIEHQQHQSGDSSMEEAADGGASASPSSPEVGQKRSEKSSPPGAKKSTDANKRARVDDEGVGAADMNDEDDDDDEDVELDPIRLAWRSKQISYGKCSEGYKRYLKEVPRVRRRHFHPATPDLHRKCSKRAFAGLVRSWRRQLHRYDPNPPPASATESPANLHDTQAFPPLSRTSSPAVVAASSQQQQQQQQSAAAAAAASSPSPWASVVVASSPAAATSSSITDGLMAVAAN